MEHGVDRVRSVVITIAEQMVSGRTVGVVMAICYRGSSQKEAS